MVGPCKSGKSTLVRGLQVSGIEAIQIAQEHSFAPRMWEIIGKPDFLIFLHCQYETTLQRGISWTKQEYEDQQPRLEDASQRADLTIETDQLPPEEVLEKVLQFLGEKRA